VEGVDDKDDVPIFCIFLKSLRSLEVNRCSVLMIECIKPYLYVQTRISYKLSQSTADDFYSIRFSILIYFSIQEKKLYMILLRNVCFLTEYLAILTK